MRRITEATIDSLSWTPVVVPKGVGGGGIHITVEPANTFKISFDPSGTPYMELPPWSDIFDAMGGDTVYLQANGATPTQVKFISFSEKR
jgi:hypothetical protein